MNRDKLSRKIAGIEKWEEDFGSGMEFRGKDGMSWYDLSINCNSIPCETDLAIIVTSWFGQLKWLKAVLAKYRLSGAFVILSFDNPFYPWMAPNPQHLVRCMPNCEHYLLANSVVHKHITYDADKRNGWFWDVRYAQGIIKQFPNIKYVYMTNGDCIIERPEGFREIIAMIEDVDLMAGFEWNGKELPSRDQKAKGVDLMSGQSTDSNIHTADVLFKAEAFHKIFDHMAEMFRVPVIGSRSPEGSMLEAIHRVGATYKHAPQQPLDKDGTIDSYSRYDPPSTFKQILGYKNLFAIQETAWNEGGEPVSRDYIDNYMDWIYFSGEERETICKYWETGDRRYLYAWWDRGEDSWYNRLYYPVEAYGPNPIFAEFANGFNFKRE